MSKVFAYRNLHRKGVVWSIRDLSLGRVVDRTPVAYFKDVELRVSEAGRQRVLRDKQKNVHAGVKGTRITELPEGLVWFPVSYNPYKAATFIDAAGAPVLRSSYAKLTELGLFVAN
jgi:hypothetical protein